MIFFKVISLDAACIHKEREAIQQLSVTGETPPGLGCTKVLLEREYIVRAQTNQTDLIGTS